MKNFMKLGATKFKMGICMLLFVLSVIIVIEPVKGEGAKKGIILSFPDKEWDGKSVPNSGICNARGGGGSTSPRIKVTNLPANSSYLKLVFTDENFGSPGDHGILKFSVPTGTRELIVPSIRPDQKTLPTGFEAVSCTFCNEYPELAETPFYVAPCSGGRWNNYYVDVYVYDAIDRKLDAQWINLGHY